MRAHLGFVALHTPEEWESVEKRGFFRVFAPGVANMRCALGVRDDATSVAVVALLRQFKDSTPVSVHKDWYY